MKTVDQEYKVFNFCSLWNSVPFHQYYLPVKSFYSKTFFSLKLQSSSHCYITIAFVILIVWVFQGDVSETHHKIKREIIDSSWIWPYCYLISWISQLNFFLGCLYFSSDHSFNISEIYLNCCELRVAWNCGWLITEHLWPKSEFLCLNIF